MTWGTLPPTLVPMCFSDFELYATQNLPLKHLFDLLPLTFDRLNLNYVFIFVKYFTLPTQSLPHFTCISIKKIVQKIAKLGHRLSDLDF